MRWSRPGRAHRSGTERNRGEGAAESTELLMDVRIDMPSDLRSDSRPARPALHPEAPSGWLTNLTVDVPASRVGTRTDIGTVPEKHKSRWGTLEFKLYGAAFVIVLPMMIWVPMRLSSCLWSLDIAFTDRQIRTRTLSASCPSYQQGGFLVDWWSVNA